MAVTDSEAAFALDLFSGLGPLTSRKMTGALCLYHAGQIFAVVGDGQIYLKAKGAMADRLAAAGSQQFSIKRRDGSRATNGYWTLPDAARDDPDLACNWARQVLAAL